MLLCAHVFRGTGSMTGNAVHNACGKHATPDRAAREAIHVTCYRLVLPTSKDARSYEQTVGCVL
jgi:hypothetical protein